MAIYGKAMYGKAIHGIARYGKAIHGITIYGKAIWQGYMAAAAIPRDWDMKLFSGTLPLKNDMLKMQESYFY